MGLLVLDAIDPHVFSGLKFDGLAGYVGGSWPDYSTECQLYPDLAKQHRIFGYAVHVDEDAEAADCELGDMTVAEVRDVWLPRQVKRGVWKPIVYANLSRWNDEGLRAGLEHYGDSIRRIVAWYTYKEGIDPSIASWAAGQQFSDHWASRNIDGNTVVDTFFSGNSQPPHTNPVHYDWFLTQQWRTPWGNLAEQGVVERYDQARKDPTANKTELQQYEAQLTWFAARVKCQAVYGDPNSQGKPDWKKDRRNWRYAQMTARSHGKKFV